MDAPAPIAHTTLDHLHRAFRELADVPEAGLARLDPLVRRVRIAEGGFFARAGERRTDLAFIVSGLIRCFHVNEDGKEYTKHFFREGSFLAATTPSELGRECEHDFQALEPTELLRFDLRDALAILSGHPSWAEANARAMERVHRIEERRVRALMLDDAQARYLQFLADFPGLEARLKQFHVASYIGVTPVSLSRLRARLRRRGIDPG